MPNLYHVLGLPSSASRTDIRAGYWCQMGRIRAGELPGLLEDSIEAALATLDNPDRRIEYDLRLAASANQRSMLKRCLAAKQRPADAKRGWSIAWPLAKSVEARAGLIGLMLLSALSLVVILAPSVHRTGPASKRVAAARAASPTKAAAAPVADQAGQDSASPEAPVPLSSASGPPPPEQTPPAPAQAPPVTQQTVAAPPAGSAPVDLVGMPAPSPVAAVTLAAVPTLSAMAMVWSRGFNGPQIVTRVEGRYCRDGSGGQIFTPVGAPLPASLTC